MLRLFRFCFALHRSARRAPRKRFRAQRALLALAARFRSAALTFLFVSLLNSLDFFSISVRLWADAFDQVLVNHRRDVMRVADAQALLDSIPLEARAVNVQAVLANLQQRIQVNYQSSTDFFFVCCEKRRKARQNQPTTTNETRSFFFFCFERAQSCFGFAQFLLSVFFPSVPLSTNQCFICLCVYTLCFRAVVALVSRTLMASFVPLAN